MKYLFIKDGCSDCQWLKDNVYFNGTKIMKLDDENAETLGMLAYFSALELARKKLPILIVETDNEMNPGEIITGKLNIKMNIENGL